MNPKAFSILRNAESPLSPAGRKLALAQAAYFLITGIWPLISIGTFQKVSGSKTDLWLVKTVGVLVGVIGAVAGLVGVRGRATAGERMLLMGSAAGLAAIYIVYVLRGRIWPVYLLDALGELVFVGGWIADWKVVERRPDAEPAGSGHAVGEGYYMGGYERRSGA